MAKYALGPKVQVKCGSSEAPDVLSFFLLFCSFLKKKLKSTSSLPLYFFEPHITFPSPTLYKATQDLLSSLQKQLVLLNEKLRFLKFQQPTFPQPYVAKQGGMKVQNR